MRKNMNFTPEELTPPNTCYADMHHVALDVKKGINEQIKLVAGEDGKTFSIIRGREGVRVGLQKAHAIGPYPIEEFQNEYGKLIRRGFRLTFDRAPSELVVKGNGKYKKMPDVDTEDIVSSLVEVSRQAFEDYYTVDTKRITDIPQISIDTARNMLLVMEKNLKTMSVKEFNDSLCIVYEVLPRRIDNLWKLVARKPEDFQAIIRRETDAINLMEEKIAEARKGIVSSAKETICDAHGIEMHPVTAEEKAEIMDMLHGNAGGGDTYDNRNHYKRAWKVTNLETRKSLNDFCEKRGITGYDNGLTRLFHGSGTENWWSIMINGLVLRPNAAYCGSAFGHGTYFAPSSQKSFNYTSGSNLWRDNSGHVGSIFLGIFDVATGKPYDIYREGKGTPDNEAQLHAISPDYDCLWAYGGINYLCHDEVVVYNEHQSSIKYLIECQ